MASSSKDQGIWVWLLSLSPMIHTEGWVGEAIEIRQHNNICKMGELDEDRLSPAEWFRKETAKEPYLAGWRRAYRTGEWEGASCKKELFLHRTELEAHGAVRECRALQSVQTWERKDRVNHTEHVCVREWNCCGISRRSDMNKFTFTRSEATTRVNWEGTTKQCRVIPNSWDKHWFGCCCCWQIKAHWKGGEAFLVAHDVEFEEGRACLGVVYLLFTRLKI